MSMSANQVIVERRRHKRFKINGDIYAILGKDSQAMGRIMDISKGGLSFSHNGGRVEPSRVSELSLFFADRNMSNSISRASLRFKSRVVSDSETMTGVQLNMSKRRCAVQFDDLTWYQNASIDNLISHQSTT